MEIGIAGLLTELKPYHVEKLKKTSDKLIPGKIYRRYA